MFRPWVCLLVIGAFGATRVLTYEDQADGADSWGLKPSDYWPDDYDDWYKDYENLGNVNDYGEVVQTNSQEVKTSLDSANMANFDNREPIDLGDQVKDEDNMDIRIEKEIQQLRGEVDTEELDENEKDPLDYQIEDNRFEPKETQFFETGSDYGLPHRASDENDESLQDFDELGSDSESDNKGLIENAEDKIHVNSDNNNNEDLTADNIEGILLKGDDNDYEDVLDAINQSVQEDQNTNVDAIIKETKRILEESDSSFDDDNGDFSRNGDDIQELVDERPLMLPPPEDDRIIEETMSILNEAESEGNEDFEKDDSLDANENKIDATILEETKTILEKLDNTLDDNIKEENQNGNIDDKQAKSENESEQLKSEDIIDDFEDLYSLEEDNVENQDTEFKKMNAILGKLDNGFDDNDGHENSPIENVDSSKQEEVQNVQLSSEEDTVDKVYEDLNEDLNHLLNTIDKLSSDDNDEENVDNWKISNENDYQSIEENNNSSNEQGADENQSEEKYAELSDDDISQLFEETFGEKVVNPDDDIAQSNEETESKNIVYTDDALVANEDSEENRQGINIESKSDINKGVITAESPIYYTGNSILDRKTYNEYMKQFKEAHKTEVDTQSVDFDKHVAADVMTLSVETPITVTSPDYPGQYPTNNIIDWIFEGDGVGIEFNITDFAINGFLGDYLLVKPGGVDETGSDGLVFTFNLNEERRYVFSDVNRMFVRFVSNSGMSLLGIRGFKFSVRQLTHRREDTLAIPEPTEPLLPVIASNFTVHLAITPDDFEDIADQFQQLIADMATLYINSNGIEPGLNTTSETARILNATYCNIKWPSFESCTWVRFGVPLVYEDDADEDEYRLDEDDLRDMWETYSRRDPFALRMRNLGIEEFTPPNDNAILTAWVIVGAAVVVAVAVVSFALWRSNCFVQYDRMPSFSDTDSVYSKKKDLDLYPAPHQDLPPLYSENEYNWINEDTTRVDMGGYANKSYVSDLYAIDSDEDEVVPTRNSETSTSPRDLYKV